MDAYPANLAEFKRYLKAGGAITLRAFGYHDTGETPHKSMDVRRTAVRVQNESAKLEGGSWLTFGRAKDWSFNGEIAHVDHDFGYLTYEMEAPE